MSDQIADRKAKLERIRALGVDPYGGRFTGVVRNADIRADAEKLNLEAGQVSEEERATFKAAGRVVLHRDIGSLIFMTVRDWTGDIQYGLSKKMVRAAEGGTRNGERGTGNGERGTGGADASTSWKLAKLLDLGDIVGAEGRLGRTKTGELTLWVTKLTMLSKALRPPPEKRLGLTDVEARYRRRHVDLYSNPDSQQIFRQRAKIIDYARAVLRARGFIEVDTPVLQPIYGGAAARPFLTHHNTLDMDLYLRISPELYLKRCLIGGLERVFEFSRCFRNEGISPRHNPEFTMLEFYQAYADYHDMMDICEAIIGGAARDVLGSTKIEFGKVEIDYTTPWPRLKYAELFRKHVGLAIDDIAAIRERARALQSRIPDFRSEVQLDDVVVVHTLFEHYVEDKLVNPTFVLDWPAPICPLTKRHPDDPNVALRFELFINGMEIGNAYSELNDPAVQRETLSKRLRGDEDGTMAVMDE
ncbi:MAG: lysine--tRNA ligase, partial [Phycisphaerae bacterium]